MVKKLTRKIKALILNKYIRVNVRHRAFKCLLAQTSGFVDLSVIACAEINDEIEIVYEGIHAQIETESPNISTKIALSSSVVGERMS